MSNHKNQRAVNMLDICLSSVGKPYMILEAYLNGVNLFETKYPFVLAEAGFAFDFDVQDWVQKSEELVQSTDQDD